MDSPRNSPNEINLGSPSVKRRSNFLWFFFSTVILGIIGLIGGFLQYQVFGSETKTISSIQCGGFNISSRVHIQRNGIEGNSYWFELSYQKDAHTRTLFSGPIGIRRMDFRPLPVNTNMLVKIFELPDVNNQENSWDSLLNIFVMGNDYSQQEFLEIADCFTKNKEEFNAGLATLSVTLPKKYELSRYPWKLAGIAYGDPSKLPALKSMGADGDFIENTTRSKITITYTGVIQGEDNVYLGDIFVGSPEINQYPSRYSEYKNDKGETIVSYISKLQKQIGIQSNGVQLKPTTSGLEFYIETPNSNNGVSTYHSGQKIPITIASNVEKGAIKVYLKNDEKKIQLLLADVLSLPNKDNMVSFSSSILPALPSGNDYYIEATLFDETNATTTTVNNKDLGYINILPPSQKISPPKVVSFTGPKTLRVGEKGVWHISATSGIEGKFDCTIFWDTADPQKKISASDSYAISTSCSSGIEQQFEMKYSVAGTYSIIAKISQGDGQYKTSALQIVITN